MDAGVKIGVVGAGAIGQMIVTAIDRGECRGAVLTAIAELDREKAEGFLAQLRKQPPLVSIEELARRSDLVVEAAGQAALPMVVPAALRQGKDLLVMSVGGLLGHEDWFQEAETFGCRIHIPSGAIAGLDGLKAAKIGRLDSVSLTSRKPVAALRGTKYIAEQRINLDDLRGDTVIFEGPPEAACRAFPATSNVAASIRLTVGAAANFIVRVVASPAGTRNVHEIRAEGDFGRMQIVLENFPSETNPRTSRLAALSALATLEALTAGRKVALPAA